MDTSCRFHLRTGSIFLKAAFQGSFKEAVEKTMTMLEDSLAAFSHVIDWVYEQGIICIRKHLEPGEVDDVSTAKLSFLPQLSYYIPCPFFTLLHSVVWLSSPRHPRTSDGLKRER